MAIHYNLKENNEEQTVFKAGNTLWFFIILFCLVGLIPLSISLLSFALDGVIAPNNRETQVMLLGVGLIFFPAGLLFWVSRFAYPKYFIFNHLKGAVQVIRKKKDEEVVAEIPYSSIQGFGLREKVTTRSNNNNAGSTRTVTYIVSVIKKDGSNWDLSSFHNESKAIKLKNTLESHVNLNAPTPNILPPKVPKDVELVQARGNISFLWRNKITAVYLLMFVISIGFGIISLGLYLLNGMDVIFFVVSGIVLIIVGILLYKFFMNLTTNYRLTITSDELQVIENDKVKKKISLIDIACIRFDFGENMLGSQIKILNHEQFSYIQEKMGSKQFQLSDISELISFTRNSINLEMDGLDMIGKIQMEQMLERIILEKGGVSVL